MFCTFIFTVLRAIAECFARLSHGLGVYSVCAFVCHTAVLCQNGAS